MASSPTILLLPLDIMNEIYSNLNYASVCAMELTCHTLHQKTSPYKSALQRKIDRMDESSNSDQSHSSELTLTSNEDIEEEEQCSDDDSDDNDDDNDNGGDEAGSETQTSLKPYTITDLLEIETWPCYSLSFLEPLDPIRRERALASPDYFACGECLKIRSAHHFTNKMLRRQRVRGRKSKVCIDCCADKGVYEVGSIVRYGGWWLRASGGGYGVVCISCEQFKVVDGGRRRKGVSCGDCKEMVMREFRRRVEGRVGSGT